MMMMMLQHSIACVFWSSNLLLNFAPSHLLLQEKMAAMILEQ
jgi:hypothetical protein